MPLFGSGRSIVGAACRTLWCGPLRTDRLNARLTDGWRRRRSKRQLQTDGRYPPSDPRAIMDMSEEDLEQFETEVELQIYKEYRDVIRLFRYVVETDRRFYLANEVTVEQRGDLDSPFLEIQMEDAWVWDMYRPVRFLERVKVMTFKDVNIEELETSDRL